MKINQLTLKQLKELDNKKVNSDYWLMVRHSKYVNRISMTGKSDIEKGVLHEVILNNKDVIKIYL